jgi:hypothetical protein
MHSAATSPLCAANGVMRTAARQSPGAARLGKASPSRTEDGGMIAEGPGIVALLLVTVPSGRALAPRLATVELGHPQDAA